MTTFQACDGASRTHVWRGQCRSGFAAESAESAGPTARKALTAAFASTCPRCQKSITIGQAIRRRRGFRGYTHVGCCRQPDPVEKGRPDTGVTVIKFASPHSTCEPSVCGTCHLVHRGPCW